MTPSILPTLHIARAPRPLPNMAADGNRANAKAWQWLRLAVNAALPVALLFSVATVLSIWCFFATAKGYVDYVEGLVLFHQTQAGQGLNVYDPVFRNKPPHSIPLYGPVFYYLAGAFQFQHSSLLPGRIISMLSLLGISGASWWFMRKRCGAGVLLASLGAVSWLALLGPYTFGANNRVDSLAIGFGISALLCTGFFSKSSWQAAIPLLLLAGFTKPTAAVAPAAAIFLTLVLDRRPKEGLCFALSVLCGAAGILAAGDLICDGNFSRNLVFSNANPMSVGQMRWFAQTCCKQFLLPAGILLGATLLQDSKLRIFALHAMLSFALAVWTSGKLGAHYNYYMEPSWAAGFCLALFLQRLSNEPARSLGLAAATAFVLQAGLYVAPHVVNHQSTLSAWPRLVQHLQTYGAQGPILTAESGAQALIGQKPYVADPNIVTRLHEAGQYDIGQILQDLRKQKFAAVIAGHDIELNHDKFTVWTIEMRTLVATHYRPVESFGDFLLYVPMSRPVETAELRFSEDRLPEY